MPTDETDEQDLLAGLTIKERRFVEAYVGAAAGNGTRAAEMAGYKGNAVTLASMAHQNLKKHQIRCAIAALTEQDPLVAGRVERLRRLTMLARGEAMYECFDREGNVVKMQVHPRDQLAALKLLSHLSGDLRRSETGEKESVLPPDLTVDELFDLAGVQRSAPRVPPAPPVTPSNGQAH